MTCTRGRLMIRVAAAMVAPGLLAAGTVAAAGPASAADVKSGRGGAAATLDGLRTADEAVLRRGGEEQRTGAGLFEMAVADGGSLQTYSVDIDNPAQSQAGYEEVPWSASSLHDNENAGKIRWILQHSYPRMDDLSSLAERSGSGTLSAETAAAGTQVAIWRYSDDVDVSAADPAAEKLADHLEKAARTAREPAASLSLDRTAISGRSGGRLGPVTVRTGAPGVAVAPASGTGATAGVKIVGKDGKPVTTARNGSKLYFETPDDGAAGAGSLTVQASAKVPVGRALTAAGEHAQSQTQVVAGSSRSSVSATASANWADSGAVPASTARKNCAKGGVDITVSNAGDAPHRFALSGKKHEIAPGGKKTLTVPVDEDQPYRIPVPGPEGSGQTFTGVLDCETASVTAATADEQTGQRGADGSDGQGIAPQGAPATAGGTDGGADGVDAAESSTDLAETGSSKTGAIIGVAVALVIVGAVALLAVRRKPAADPDAATGPSEDTTE